jgi:Cu/Ag efflux pump CusA
VLSGTRANVAIRIFGDDLLQLREFGTAAQGAVQGVQGLVDLSVEQQTDIPTVRVAFDRERSGAMAYKAGAAAEALENSLVGREVGQILEGQIAVQVVVRYPHADQPDLETIRDTPLRTSSGGAV